MNWARTITSTTKEKARRVQIEKLKNDSKSKVSKLKMMLYARILLLKWGYK